MSAGARRRLGILLVALGIAGILWGVFHVLGATTATRPGGPARAFEERRGYDEVKEAVHESFLGGLLRSLAGLAVAWAGTRLLASANRDTT